MYAIRSYYAILVNKLRFKTPGAPMAEPASLRLTLAPDGQGGFKRVDAEAGTIPERSENAPKKPQPVAEAAPEPVPAPETVQPSRNNFV